MTVESRKITKILVANRGEIAIRVIRAARDAGIPSVAVYAEPDANAPFVSLADEAFALGGQNSAESYLVFDKILDAAKKSGANAIHPGYGFLSENGDFAEAVINAGLIWIGPSPQSIRDLGDKVTARHIAQRAKAPMAPGTKEPVKDVNEVVAFAEEFGLPIAIKAAFGGGGRGMKVAYTKEEVPELYESATREALAAFGRGECFVERYMDKARHVECQVLADMHGNVIVAGTRDCSLQRRFQKLVEEAPAPFLTEEQRTTLHESAKRICKEAGYYGAGTVEYLVDSTGLINFLEVNTRSRPVWIWCGNSSASPKAKSCTSSRIPRLAGTHSNSASTVKMPAATSCRPPVRSPNMLSRPAPVCAWNLVYEKAPWLGASSTQCWQS